MYEQRRKQNEFVVDIVNNSVKAMIEHIPNLIVAKMAAVLSGTPLSEIIKTSEDGSAPNLQDDPFVQKLMENGLSEDDIFKLKREGVDLSSLTLGSAI